MYKHGLILALIAIATAGCHRPQTMSAVYNVPDLDSQQKVAALEKALKTGLPDGIKSIDSDIQAHTLTVTFNEQLCRTMNVEEMIAEAGFAANYRPAYAKK